MRMRQKTRRAAFAILWREFSVSGAALAPGQST